jgi:hypothetical protein
MLPVWPRDLLAKLLKHYIEADADPIHVFGPFRLKLTNPDWRWE